MTHAEYLYLLGLADITRQAAERARAEGETFHPIRPFFQLASGLEATAWSDGKEMGLRLRHPFNDAERWAPLVALAFHAFFPKGFERSDPVTEGAWMTHQGTTQCSTSS